MPYITRIICQLAGKAESIDIDLTPAPGQAFRHLVVTGPNGSGKTRLLSKIGRVLDHLTENPEHSIALGPLGNAHVIEMEGTRVEFSAPISKVLHDFERGTWLAVSLPAERSQELADVRGPSRIESEPCPASRNLTGLIRQFLVNQHAKWAYAQAEGDEAESARLKAWFARLTVMLAELTGQPGLTIHYQRDIGEIVLATPDGHRFALAQLGGGHRAALAILANLLIRADRFGALNGRDLVQTTGVALIDEVDAHLDSTVSSRFAPQLERYFPELQLIMSSLSAQAAIRHAAVVAL